jgi:hypothetical protein
LIRFLEIYGDIPLCNGTGQKMKPKYGEFEKFSINRLDTLLEELA